MIYIAILTLQQPNIERLLENPLFWEGLKRGRVATDTTVLVLTQGSPEAYAHLSTTFTRRILAEETPRLVIWDGLYDYGTAGGRQRMVDWCRGKRLTAIDIIVLLNDDVIIRSAAWLQQLVHPIQINRADICGTQAWFAKLHDWTEPVPNSEPAPSLVYVGDNQLAIRGSVFLTGLDFDPQFNPAYWDVDFCLAAARRGFRVASVETPDVAHADHPVSEYLAQITYRNRERFLEKWGLCQTAR